MSLAETRPSPSGLRYKRVLLKISGEALMGEGQYGIDTAVCEHIAQAVLDAAASGAELCLVIGGGNIFRGVQGAAKGMERASADYMGMLATVMNALAMQSALERLGVATRVLSAIPMQSICEPYIRRRAVRHMEKGRVVIFAAGTGNPFFTTDTAAALRAIEINAEVLLKATKVDGVYSDDPVRNPAAQRYRRLTFDRVLAEKLNVMDATAIVMCRDNHLPLQVFNLNTPGDLTRSVRGDEVGTIVTCE